MSEPMIEIDELSKRVGDDIVRSRRGSRKTPPVLPRQSVPYLGERGPYSSPFGGPA